MQSIDQSVVSKSSATSGVSRTSKGTKSLAATFEALFPLFDQMYALPNYPGWLNYFILIYSQLQVLMFAMWPTSNYYTDKTDVGSDILSYLLKILWYSDYVNMDSILLIDLILFLVLTAIIVAWISFQLLYYKSKKTFMKWSLYVSRFMVQVIVPILVYPTAAFVSSSFIYLYDSGDSIYWVHLIFGVICYAINLVLFRIVLQLNASSIILSQNPFVIVIHSSIFIYTVITTIVQILAAIFTIFQDWLLVVLQVIHLLIAIFALIKSFDFPFLMNWGNTIYSSILTTTIILDIVMMVLDFISTSIGYLSFLIGIIVLVISVIVYYFVFKSIEKKIHKQLNVKDINSEEEKAEYFDELSLNSTNRAMLYLYTGMKKMSNLFVDMSLTTYLAKNSTDSELIAALAKTTSFFPSESRKLNSVLRTIVRRRDLTLGNRFMIFQLQRIRTLRASSSSIESNELINNLHTMNINFESKIRSFWTTPNPNIGFCERMGSELKDSMLKWKEALFTFPNNSKISYEFSRFLSESLTDFDEAIYQQQRGDLIEGGRNFATDNSFRSFARMFPQYLLEEVLDIKGNRIKKKATTGESSSFQNKSGSSGAGMFSSSGSSFTIDAELEDSIGKKLFLYSRMRLALHHSICERKSQYRLIMIAWSFIALICCIASFVGVYIYMVGSFDRPMYTMDNMYNTGMMRFSEDLAIFCVFLDWCDANDKLYNFDLVGDQNNTEIDSLFTNYINYREGNYPVYIMNHVEETRVYYNNFISKLAEMSADAIDVYTYSQSILQSTATLQFCKDSKMEVNTPATFKNKLIYMLYLNTILASTDDPKNLYDANEWCEVLSNSFTFVSDTTQITDSISNDAYTIANGISDTFTMITIIIAIALFVITFIPILVLILLHVHSINRILRIMSSMPAEMKEAAKAHFRTDIDKNESNTSSDSASHFTYTIVDACFYFVLSVIFVLLVYFYTDNMSSTNQTIANYNKWFTFALRRLQTCGEASLELLQIVVLQDFEPDFTNQTHNQRIYKEDMDEIMNAHNALIQGDSTIDAFYDIDSDIDAIHFAERCTLGHEAQNVHDLYCCASLAQQLAVYRDLGQQIVLNPIDYECKINDETSLNALHIITNHIWDANIRVTDRFTVLLQNTYDEMLLITYIILVIVIVLSIVLVIYTFIFVSKVDTTYSTMLSLIKHINPLHLVQNKDLMNFLLNRKDAEEDKTMGVAQSVLHNSVDAIVCTSLNGVIEIINPAVSSILGFTPEQLLGQPVLSLFKPEDSDKVSKQLEMMQSGQSGAIYEDHLICLSDSAVEVSFGTTIIGMKNEGSEEISSYVFILSDETELLKQQAEAEQAKAKSEKLLYQILPKDIVVRLNRGEKDISFTVAHATIMFIDIVKFSEYTASLTPQEIMGNLSMIFAAFDSSMAKYPTLIKIKLIGDDYMAAAGLFGKEEDNPQVHAEEAVKFALDCLAELEELNMKLSASLEVRIGINTGGPLIAGVLGTDKPVFDIIGDPINIAARLQSTDIPGKVQISQHTKELVENSNFSIEERGEVFLKGKGKQTTYLVTPISGFLHITNSISQMQSSIL